MGRFEKGSLPVFLETRRTIIFHPTVIIVLVDFEIFFVVIDFFLAIVTKKFHSHKIIKESGILKVNMAVYSRKLRHWFGNYYEAFQRSTRRPASLQDQPFFI